MSSPPLGRLKMLDLSRQLPGPFCSTLLADLGMDVLVITAPRDPFGLGIPFLARRKRSMTLDLKTDAGREIFGRLVDEADVLLEGFRPGVMQRLGFDWERLHARNPRLVYCAISGYGQDGPYRDKVGHDVNYLGYAGVLEYSGAPDGPPMIPPVQVADVGAGSLMAAVGILSAIVARQETGRGQLVDISMLDGAAAWNVCHQTIHWFSGVMPQRGKEQLTGHWPCYARIRDARRALRHRRRLRAALLDHALPSLRSRGLRTGAVQPGAPGGDVPLLPGGVPREDARAVDGRARRQGDLLRAGPEHRGSLRRSAAAPPWHGRRHRDAGRPQKLHRLADQALRDARARARCCPCSASTPTRCCAASAMRPATSRRSASRA